MPRSPSQTGSSFNSYTGQLAVSVQPDGSSQWAEGKFLIYETWHNYWQFFNNQTAADEYSRAQSSSVSPRGGGGYCSSASTPHSSTGGSASYGTTSLANGYGPPAPMTGLSSPASTANVFNSASSK
jgi:early B-cell factor